MEAFISGLRGLGYAIAPTVIMILGVCVFRVIWLLLYFPSHRTFQTLAMTYPISWLLIILMSGFYIFRELRKLPRSAEK